MTRYTYDERVAAGQGPHPCSDGLFWISAQEDVLEHLTPGEAARYRAEYSEGRRDG